MITTVYSLNIVPPHFLQPTIICTHNALFYIYMPPLCIICAREQPLRLHASPSAQQSRWHMASPLVFMFRMQGKNGRKKEGVKEEAPERKREGGREHFCMSNFRLFYYDIPKEEFSI